MASSTLAAPSSTRTSTRVRKHPGNVYRSSPQSASAKRKRADADEINGNIASTDDDPSEDDTSEEEGEEDEPDEEEVRDKRARARKNKSTAPKNPAQKKARINGTATLAIRSTTNGGKRRPPKTIKALNNPDAEDVGSIFADVFAHGRDLQETVQQWCQSFAEHESLALTEIINFVLRAAGCVNKVTAYDIEDPDAVTGRIMDLQDEYQATHPTDYPLMAKSKTAATVKQGVTGFLDVLIKFIAQTGVLFENQELIENIHVWFSTMSTAANRPFRHTATVVSLSVVTSLCEVCKDVANEAAKSLRQAETERKKKSSNKARVKEIVQKAQAASQRQEYIDALLKDWFDTVFVHRYKDVDAAIRRECAAALGDWVVTMPSVYFDGQHLRYMGWMLSDTHASVRLEAVKQLARLYRLSDMIGGLKSFTERFRGRLVEMATSDADCPVRTAAVELLDLLRENGLLEPDDVDAVGRLIFESDTKVRKAAAKFLAEGIDELYTLKLDEIGGADALDEALPDAGDESYEVLQLAWLKLKCLAETLQAYHNEDDLPNHIERSRNSGGLVLHAAGAESRFSLAGDDLYDKISELRDWRIISGYLLFDASSIRSNGAADDPVSQLKHECLLSPKEEVVLLDVLNVSVRHELEAAVVNTAAAKPKPTKKQKAAILEEQEETAREMAVLIPKLLEKFGDSPETAGSVLRLEEIFTLPSLKDLRQDSSTYGVLLDNIRRQFMSHTSDQVLEPATKAILHAKSYGDLDESTAEKVGTLWDDIVLNFVQLIDPDTITDRGSASTEILTALSDNLLRIIRLSSVSDPILPLEDATALSSLEIREDIKGTIDCILALIQRARPAPGNTIDQETAHLDDEVASRAAEAALFYFQWRFRSIRDRVQGATATDIPYEELEALATRRDLYSETLSSILQQRKGKDEVSAALAGCMLDLHVASATLRNVRPGPNMSDDYTIFIMDLDRSKQQEVMKAFIAAEQNFAKLSNKRLGVPLQDADELLGNDDFNDDPASDPESDDEEEPGETQTQASQQRKEAKLITTLLAEQRLCQLTSKIIYAVLGGIMETGSTRRRVERNKGKLGHNFKEVCAYFDVEDVLDRRAGGKSRAKGKAQAKPAANAKQSKEKSKGADRKSHAIIAESEDEDEIEDDGDDDAALRTRELIDVDEDAVDGGQVDDEEMID